MHGMQLFAWFTPVAISMTIETIVPFIGLAFLVFLLVSVLIRRGRNAVLEHMLVQADFGPTENFRGSLIVRDHRPGIYLKLALDTGQVTLWKKVSGGMLAINYRPLFVAPIQEVDFDGPTRQIMLKTKKGSRSYRFDELSSIRMREIHLGKSMTSLWVVELMPNKGRPILIVASSQSDRQSAFEHTGPLVKAISAITGMPMQAYVAGNVWTPGWPPKLPSISA